MAPRASGSSSLATLSQALSLWAILSLSFGSCGPNSTSSGLFLFPFCVAYTSSIPSIPPHKLPLFTETLPTLFSSELVRTCPCKMKPYEDPEAKPLISYIPWTKAELQAIVKDFPLSNWRFSQICWGIQHSHSHLSTWFLWHTPASLYASQWRPGQHWVKTTTWENPERSLELQLRDQPTNLLCDHAQAIARQLHGAIPRAFSKSVDWNEIQPCTQNSNEPVHDYYNWLQIIFKENLGLPSDVDSAR